MSAPTQIYRPFRVKTESLGDDDLLLDSFTGSERISDPFRFVLRVLSPDPNLDMQSLLNKAMVLSLKLDKEDTERHIHGNIKRMKLLEIGEDGMAAYEAEIVPWFWFLNLFSDCRIFQYMSVIDIVQKVFRDRGFTDFENRTTGTYAPRVYCVQYRETDFNFVSRLLEEEGIFYFFEQSQDKHTLVLGDDTSAFVSCPNQDTAMFMPSSGGKLTENTVATLEAEFSVKTGMATHTDYDFTKPNSSLSASLDGNRPGEIYDYPGKYDSKGDGDRYARIRLEEQEVDISTVRGDSNCMGFECGYQFELTDHIRDSANTDYTLLGLEHRGRNTSYRAGKVDPFEYKNRFEAIPNSVPFRPARRARKPVIDGTQTAVVVGKSGEEIWTDEYGRVKVQFFWDRVGVSDENSSCWIRVAHGWAGKQWGFFVIPRIGQEVVVSFLEGDPDRPIITGSVYNAEQMPPYTLPDYQTKSTWKSMSSKGGGGFNELRFEDEKGSEQIFIHGEKNIDTRIKNNAYENIDNDSHMVVKNDHIEHVKNDHHLTIDRDQVVKLGRDHHFKIEGKQAIAVTQSRSLTVNGDVIEVFNGAYSQKVATTYYVKGGPGGIVIEAPCSPGITLVCGGNSVVVDSTGVTIKGTMVVIDASLVRIASGPGSPAGTGTPGNAVSPTAPKTADDADDADPGKMAKIKAQQQMAGKGKYGTVSPAPFKPPTPVQQAQAQAQAVAAGEPPPPTHFIEINLVDEENKPIAGEAYKITLPNGQTVAEGTLDDKGYARVDGVDPGQCKVTFPNRDKSVWKPK